MRIIIITGAICIFVVFMLLQACLLASLNDRDAIPPPQTLNGIRRHAYQSASRRHQVRPSNPYVVGTWQHNAWSTEYQQAVQLIERDTRRPL